MDFIRSLGHIVADAARTFWRFIYDGARVLAAHWPQLVGLFLIGWIGRMGFLWIATEVSDWSPTVAVLILPLAPLCTLLSFVLMMRAMAPTLPAFSGMIEHTTRRTRWNEDLTVAGQVMIPFLAVYASAGLLKQDSTVFLLDSAADEWMNTTIQEMDLGRANYAPGMAIVAFILIAIVLRKTISLLKLTDKHLAWAGMAAYLEVLWIMTLATALSTQLQTVTDWITSRQLIASIIGWAESVFATIREWSSLAGAVLDGISAVIGNLGSVVIVPVAWLAIGAAVYGHQLHSATLAVPGHEEMTNRIKKIPSPVRRAVGQVTEPIVTPIQSTLGAIRKIAIAGILPMMMFCLVFLVAGGVQSLAALGMRGLIGPGSGARQFAMEPYATLAERGVYFVLVLTLLAAAVNAVVLAQREQTTAAAAAGPQGATPDDAPIAAS